MKKRIFSLMMLVLFSITVLLTGCGSSKGESETPSADPANSADTATPNADIKPGVVLADTGRGDKSFNDSAIAGLELAKEKLGIDYKDITPKDSADFEKSIDFLAKEGHNPVFCIGFTASEALSKVAPNYPDTNFIIIDYDYGTDILPNVKSIVFKEEQGSFLAGALAASVSKTGVIGFIGAMETPLIEKFEVGYRAGAKHVRPDIDVKVSYIAADPSGFGNASKAKEIALNLISQKADVLYHAAGGAGVGMIEAAAEKGVFAIGVDSNQNFVKPGTVIASMIKRVDTTVFQTMESVVGGTLKTGATEVFDLVSNGIGLTDLVELMPEETEGVSEEDQAKIKEAKASIGPEAVALIAQLQEDIINGGITVPATRAELGE